MATWESYNGVVKTIAYDSDLWPTSITASGAESLAFSYDVANRITHIGNGLDSSMTETLGYDALNRLTSVSSSAQTASYTYDADGNRTHQVINGTATNFAYASGSNRLLGASDGTSYGYDADGNTVTIDGHTAYTYGPFNRLVNAGGYAYTYSAAGQRVEKMGASGTTYFAPGSGTLLAEDLNNIWRDYVYLNGRLVSVTAHGDLYSVHGDQTGRPLAITATNSHTALWQAAGQPFSRYVTVNNWGTLNLGFPGQYLDAEDGLWHNGYRDYDASMGRYIESDPIGLAGGVNTYAYVGNNPISFVDPLGLCGCNHSQSTGGQNNIGQPASGLNMNDWQFAQELSAGDSATVDSSGGIAIQAGGIAGPLPTDQFGYFVTQRPLAQNGGYEPVAAPMNWGNPKFYSSGLVGSGGTNTMIFSAMPGPGGNRWFVNFPEQESAHGNAANEYLDIYVARCH